MKKLTFYERNGQIRGKTFPLSFIWIHKKTNATLFYNIPPRTAGK